MKSLADEIVLGSVAGYEKNGVLTVKVYAWVLKRHRNKEGFAVSKRFDKEVFIESGEKQPENTVPSDTG